MPSTIKTIKRNSKEFKGLVDRATSIKGYSLSSNFEGYSLSGSELKSTIERLEDRKAKFSVSFDTQTNAYTISVHSNLWYTVRTD